MYLLVVLFYFISFIFILSFWEEEVPVFPRSDDVDDDVSFLSCVLGLGSGGFCGSMDSVDLWT